ncbi:MAG: MFS transporter, partial [Micrococcales bacterium]|nr:MFS transporter [Micrococcales bacterium]
SVVPFAWALHTHGWTPAFGALAVVGVATTVAAWAGVRDRPPGTPPPPRPAPSAGLGRTVMSAGTWLGFFSHNLGGAGPIMFALMWGFPYLVRAQGLSEAQASGVLAVCMVTQMVGGPLVGMVSSRMSARRAQVVLGYSALCLVGWLMLIVPTTRQPLWVIIVALVAVFVGGPVSLLGLELAGEYASHGRKGSATGVANTGGFVGALAVMFAVGVVLDLRSSTPDLSDYRVALVSMLVMWAVGTLGVALTWRRARHLQL